MIVKNIHLDTVEKVKVLVREATKAPFCVDIVTERFTVNAKSILGIFSLNRSYPLTLRAHTEHGSAEAEAFFDSIREYIV